MKKILIVSFSKIANDVRITRHIEALHREASIITIGYGPIPRFAIKHVQIPDNYKYLPLTLRGIQSLLLQNDKRACSETTALQFVSRAILQLDFDVIFLNDVQTLPLLEELEDNRKIIIDMHEFAPKEMEDDWRFRLLLQSYYTRLCIKYLSKASLLLTVSDGLKHGYDTLCGTSAHVVRNICRAEELSIQPVKRPLRVVHSGLAVRGRRLEKMIYAVDGLENIEFDLYLVEAPRQSRYLAFLKKEASKTQNVRVKSPVPQHEIATNLNSYDVGLILIAASNFSLKHGLPNKLFDHIQARIMTICGPSPDMAHIVREYELGHVLESYEPEELRHYLEKLDQSDISFFKKNADNAATILNQEKESQKLVHLVKSVCTDRP